MDPVQIQAWLQLGVAGVLAGGLVALVRGHVVARWSHDETVAHYQAQLDKADKEIARLQASEDRYINLALNSTKLAHRATDYAEATAGGNSSTKAPQ